MENSSMDAEETEGSGHSLTLAYQIERVMYAVAIFLGSIASVYTIRKFRRCCKKNLDVAARLISYKISLSVADALILFVYAPAQLVWISTYWWYGGELMCRVYKFTVTFAFHLTGNMQVLIAFDRLITMTRINKLHVKGTSDYNTRLFLSLAWILALVCSVPQFVFFKLVSQNNETKTQCTAVQNEYFERQTILNIKFNDFIEKNETEARLLVEESIISLEEDIIWMEKWEKIYNVVHVLMMCIIPYLLELIFYTLILALLSDAEKGEFSGFRRFIYKKVIRFCHVRRKNERRERRETISIPTVEEDPQTDSPIRSPRKANLQRKPSRSVNSSPTHARRLNELRVSYRNRFQSVDVGMRRMTMEPPVHSIVPNLHTSMDVEGVGESSHLLSVRNQSRRASAPCGMNKIKDPRISVPWVNTVTIARKNTKKKAFLMLTCNLLLWLPYCIHAISSSFIIIDHFNFQFACALVVFNAITNILL